MTNVTAFLSLISHAEGTDKADNPYRVCFGFKHTILDLSDHPANTGEWMGEPLDFLGPAYVGKKSTAAGRYQLIRATWNSCKSLLVLHDFTGPSQDAAAMLLIKQRGAIDLVNEGFIEQAISLCSAEWASLPGSTSGQPQQQAAALIDHYQSQGGILAA